MVYPCIPQFYYIKLGFKGVYIPCFPDVIAIWRHVIIVNDLKVVFSHCAVRWPGGMATDFESRGPGLDPHSRRHAASSVSMTHQLPLARTFTAKEAAAPS